MSGKARKFPPKIRIIAFMAPKVEQVMMIEFKGVTMISSTGKVTGDETLKEFRCQNILAFFKNYGRIKDVNKGYYGGNLRA